MKARSGKVKKMKWFTFWPQIVPVEKITLVVVGWAWHVSTHAGVSMKTLKKSHWLKNGNGKDTFVWAYHDQTADPSLEKSGEHKGKCFQKWPKQFGLAESLWRFPRFVGIRLHPICTQVTHLWRFLPCLSYTNVVIGKQSVDELYRETSFSRLVKVPWIFLSVIGQWINMVYICIYL